MAKIIGISGGVASGKTTAAAILGGFGAHVIDADAIAHEVLGETAIREKIVSKWGKAVLNERGDVDRKRLGSIVFSNKKDLKDLEEIVHPPVLDRIREEIRKVAGQREKAVVVLDAALLNESGLAAMCDGVIFVDASGEVRSSRAKARGWSEDECARRERRQMDVARKRAQADWVVDNSGSMESLGEQLREIWIEIVENKKT